MAINLLSHETFADLEGLEIHPQTNRSKKSRKGRPKPSMQESPWDAAKRKPVEFETLDLDKSYEKDVKALQRQQWEAKQKLDEDGKAEAVDMPPRKRRYSSQDMLVWDAKDLPKGWYPTENDIADDDIDGQIDRCFERLDECMMPQFFEQRLYGLIAKKDEIIKKQSAEEPNLQPLEAARVVNLEALWKMVRDKGDPDGQLVNIEEIIDAYRYGRLRWIGGLVTYWSHGKQICQPRPFSWDEFEAINKRYKGNKSFWTEGTDGPGPEQMNYRLVIEPSSYHQHLHTYRVAFRIPGVQWYDELEVLYDTGATIARIYEQDIINLQGPFDITDHDISVIGVVRSQELTTYTADQVIMMEVCLINSTDPTLRETPWVKIQCAVTQGSCPVNEPKRLDGPWLRWIMHHAIEPSGRNEIVVASNRRELQMQHFGLPRTRNRTMPRLPLDNDLNDITDADAPYTLRVPPVWLPGYDGNDQAPNKPPPYREAPPKFGPGGVIRPPKIPKPMPQASRHGIRGEEVIGDDEDDVFS